MSILFAMAKSRRITPSTIGGRYEIRRRLGAGSFGVVYEGVDTKGGGKVALKVMKSGLLMKGADLVRLQREIENAYRIESDYVAKLLSLVTTEEEIALVLELVNGKTLYDHMKSGTLFSVRESIGFARQIASGLCDMHELGIVHRDLKLENIAVDEGGIAKLLDLGSSIVASSLGVQPNLPGFHSFGAYKELRATSDGQVIGTLLYLCPHYLTTGTFDHRVDLYAFGLILYELLTGKPPFAYKNAKELMARKLKGQIEPPSTLRQECPSRIDELVLHCLAVNPDERPNSFREVHEILSAENQRLPVQERSTNPNPHDMGRSAAVKCGPFSSSLELFYRGMNSLFFIAWPLKVVVSAFGRISSSVLSSGGVRAFTVVAFLIFLAALLLFRGEENALQRYLSDSWKAIVETEESSSKPNYRFFAPTKSDLEDEEVGGQ
jgi:serine/threonine protein kinase